MAHSVFILGDIALTLADLLPGQQARISAVDTRHPAILRLMILGLVEDTLVEVDSSAIGGDPIEVRVWGAAVSVRREDALKIEVEPGRSHD